MKFHSKIRRKICRCVFFFSSRLFKRISLCFWIEAVNQAVGRTESFMHKTSCATKWSLFWPFWVHTQSSIIKKTMNWAGRWFCICFGVFCFGWALTEKVEAVLFLFLCSYSAVKRNSSSSTARSTTICLTCLTSALHACPFLSMKTGSPNNARLNENHRLDQNITGRLPFPPLSLPLFVKEGSVGHLGEFLLLSESFARSCEVEVD